MTRSQEHPDWDAVGTWPHDHPELIKRSGSWLHGMIDRQIQGTPKGFRHSSYRTMRRPLADALVEHETRTPVFSPLVVQLSNQVHNVEVRHSERKHGTSTITLSESIDRVHEHHPRNDAASAAPSCLGFTVAAFSLHLGA